MSGVNHEVWESYPLHVPTPAGTDNVDVVTAARVGMRDGDLLWYDDANGVCKSANAFTWDTNIATTRKKFAALFAGVLSGAVDKHNVVGTRLRLYGGLYRAPCTATTWAVGNLVGAAQQSGANALHWCNVAKVTDPREAFGVCMEAGTSATTVRFRLFPHRVGDRTIQERINVINLPCGDVVGGGNAASWIPGKPVALITAKYIALTAESTGARAIGFKKNSTALDDGAETPTAITITVSNPTAAGVERALSAEFRPAEAVHQFGPTDTLNITDDGGGASQGLVQVTYFEL